MNKVGPSAPETCPFGVGLLQHFRRRPLDFRGPRAQVAPLSGAREGHLHVRLRGAPGAAVPVAVHVVQGAVEVVVDRLQEAAGGVVDEPGVAEQRQTALRQGGLGRRSGWKPPWEGPSLCGTLTTRAFS